MVLLLVEVEVVVLLTCGCGCCGSFVVIVGCSGGGERKVVGCGCGGCFPWVSRGAMYSMQCTEMMWLDWYSW